MTSKHFLGLLGSLAICTPIFAQQAPDNGPGPGGPDQSHGEPPRPRGGGVEQMLNRLKDDLQATDDQWTTVAPKVRTILQLEHELYSGGPPGGGPPGGPQGGGPPGGGPDGGGPNGGGGGNGGPPDGGGNGGGQGGGQGGGNAMADPNAPPADSNATTRPATFLNAEADSVRKARRELGHLIHDPDATDEEMKSAVKELRAARADAKTALTAAQADLKPSVSDRQQAILMSFGILE